jgi:hypothetical protein
VPEAHPPGLTTHHRITGKSSGGYFCVNFWTLRDAARGHREVTSETLLPIILEVGTLGHILLTDVRTFQLPNSLPDSLRTVKKRDT